MFNLFGKKEKTVDPSLNPRNPAALFPLLGPGFEAMWGEFVRKQHKAVDAFSDYEHFKKDLLKEFPDVDFDRTIYEIETDHKPIVISAGEGIYLKALDLDKGFFIASEHFPEDAAYVEYREYVKIVSNLTSDENKFSNKMRDYISWEIKPLVEEASEDLIGINMCESTIPINTMMLVKYHRFLAAEMVGSDYSTIDDDAEKWEKIGSAPLFKTPRQNNPIIPIGIQYLDALVLDWLCFVSMARPTIDTYKIINYKRDDGMTVKESLKMAYGEGALTIAIKTIKDLNCSAFRSFARQGLKLEEGKNRDDVINALKYFG